MNSRTLLAALVAGRGRQSVTALASALKLTRPTVEAALVDLMAEGWVVESDPEPTPNKAGRRARMYQFNATAGYLLGVDLTPRSVTAVLATLQGDALARVRFANLDLSLGADAESALRRAVSHVVEEACVQREAVVATVVGVPGVVNREGELMNSVVVPDWVSTGSTQAIQSFLRPGVTHFDNDARLAATAEASWGALRGVENGVHVILGRQMGAGLLIDGRVVRGHHGAAGEIGGLGSLGWGQASESLAGERGSVEELLAAAAREEKAAAAAVSDFAANVANGIAALALAVDPEVVSIGGDISSVGELFLKPLREAVTDLGASGPELRLSLLGADAVAMGAVARARDYCRREVLELPVP